MRHSTLFVTSFLNSHLLAAATRLLHGQHVAVRVRVYRHVLGLRSRAARALAVVVGVAAARARLDLGSS